MEARRQPVIVELEERQGGSPVPSRVLWGGRDLAVHVRGAPWTGWTAGTMHYVLPVTCGDEEHTLSLDTATWTWTIDQPLDARA